MYALACLIVGVSALIYGTIWEGRRRRKNGEDVSPDTTTVADDPGVKDDDHVLEEVQKSVVHSDAPSSAPDNEKPSYYLCVELHLSADTVASGTRGHHKFCAMFPLDVAGREEDALPLLMGSDGDPVYVTRDSEEGVLHLHRGLMGNPEPGDSPFVLCWGEYPSLRSSDGTATPDGAGTSMMVRISEVVMWTPSIVVATTTGQTLDGTPIHRYDGRVYIRATAGHKDSWFNLLNVIRDENELSTDQETNSQGAPQ